MGLILVNRSFSASLWAATIKPNRALWLLLSAVSATLAIVIFWQPARKLFHFGEFNGHLFALCIGASVVTLLILEAIKSLFFKQPNTV